MSLSKRASVMTFQRAVVEYGGGGGILSKHPKKFPVVMVKSNFFVVNERKVEKRFCQC